MTTTTTALAERYTPGQVEAARVGLTALALDSDDLADGTRSERIAQAVERLTVEQVGGPPLAYPALLPLVDRGLFAAVMSGVPTVEVDVARVAVAASGLIELCVLARWSDESPRELVEVVSDLADAIWAVVDQGEIKRAGELMDILLDGALLDIAEAAAPASPAAVS